MANFFLLFNLLVIAVAGLFFAMQLLQKFKLISISYSRFLKANYFVLLGAIVLAIASQFAAKTEEFLPPVKTAVAVMNSSAAVSTDALIRYVGLSPAVTESFYDRVSFQNIFLMIFIMTTLFAVFRFSREIWQLRKLKKQSLQIRKLGHTEVYVHPSLQVPVSFYLLPKAIVMLPQSVLGKSSLYKTALLHELQHHRQKDTRFVLLISLLDSVCVLNPLWHAWKFQLMQLQEFACDEVLINQKNIESHGYASNLLEVAQQALNQRTELAFATNFLLGKNSLLKRRIENMFLKHTKQTHGLVLGFAMVFTCLVLAGTAMAGGAFLGQKQISISEAQALADKANAAGEFKVVINDLVLKQLNRYIGTAKGRAYMRGALQRMKAYQEHISDKLEASNMPKEFIAIPIVESGYKNLPESQNSAWPQWKAAGLWQFVRQTAKNYGLEVSQTNDERLDIDKSTTAALQLLTNNFVRFGDWNLSMMAYNMGESALEKGIRSVGSKDAWTLIRNGVEGDANYLAKVMAAMIIVANPESVN